MFYKFAQCPGNILNTQGVLNRCRAGAYCADYKNTYNNQKTNRTRLIFYTV
jgi:hypothetical protein